MAEVPSARKLQDVRPSSVPPHWRVSPSLAPTTVRHSGLVNQLYGRTNSEPTSSAPKDATFKPSQTSLDLIGHLQRSGTSVVKTRSGSVLSRGFILTTDHYPSGRALDLDLNIHGAPNFRAPRQGGLNVFGVAQPRTQGLRAILSVLRCKPGTTDPTHVVWFSTREEPLVYISGRPFVLRDASEPRKILSLSDRAENLEAIELRLKNDILQESTKYGGLILTHNEIASDSGEGAILPTWTSVDSTNVRTSRQLWEQMKADGWNVDYHRIPISPDRPIEDNYLDAYLRVIKSTDPLHTALVFSSSRGAERTTFGMVAALLVRRRQLMVQGMEDPYVRRALTGTPHGNSLSGAGTPTHVGSPATETRIIQAIEQTSAQQDLNRTLLRLTHLLQQCLRNKDSQSAIELLLAQPALRDKLMKAYMGNYGVVQSLVGCLDSGLQTKKLVDRIIDDCDDVTNLREEILAARVEYSLTTLDDKKGERHLDEAVKAIEKYVFITTFASYVETQNTFDQSFSEWLKPRHEIRTQLSFLRKSSGSRLNVFAPVNDLSALSKTTWEIRALVPGRKNDIALSGGQILGDEYSDHVVKHRCGLILRESTLLKSDQWRSESHHVEHGVRGAINFRNIPNSNIYALGQPSVEAIDEVVERVKQAHLGADRVVWITLREEPIVYINGAPYCLRRERFSLRNMKDYGGISASRLEVLEERLRDDVLAELNAFGGRLLLHTETSDGSVVPIWEEVRDENVAVLKDVMASRNHGIEVFYKRVPITAERAPDFADLSDLIEVVVRNESPDTPIVLNCQLGRGRSTLTATILLLIQKWLRDSRLEPYPRGNFTTPNLGHFATQKTRPSYQVINNLLRVIRKGPAVKNTVDDAIEQCCQVYDLIKAIEDARVLALEATDERQKRIHLQKGLNNLRRYFGLIVFQTYLQSIEPDTIQSFENMESFIKTRPVIKTFEKELMADGLDALKPLERAEDDGTAHPDEVKQVVFNRSGNILSPSTILKSDFFPNLQKMSLPERIDGAPNFRRVPLTPWRVSSSQTQYLDQRTAFSEHRRDLKWVCGSGMPTVQGLRRALSRLDAHPEGNNSVVWTSLREEPVVYVRGRPHVLRLVDRPLENVKATGITTSVVEAMEDAFKKDVLRELRAGNGRVLLHDEVEERPGVFSIIPLWEHIDESDVMTPRDVFNLMANEGYKIDYGRVAITDEQAPLPDALSQLLDRIQSGCTKAGDFVFNCQMGRGRTTTGMVTACLIFQTMNWRIDETEASFEPESDSIEYHDLMDGPSEEEAYLQGEYKTILQLVGVLSHGKIAKRLTDHAIDLMQDVQNLRKAVYDNRLKVEASGEGPRRMKLESVSVNYLYRYGTLIVFANYLLEMRENMGLQTTFPEWLREHREITQLLKRRSLD